MRNQLDKAIRRVMAVRHAERRRAAVLVILALLTILSVSWRLHQVGTAMTDDGYSCGYEEHAHSDACYTEVLVCGYEDEAPENPADSAREDGEAAPAAHSHTADCYQRVLTCTLPEHTHTLECLADITADVETPADWDEQSEGVSSFWSDAMTEIAQRQLGYTESAKNFTVDKALGETLAQAHHYTRYGDWYGNPYGNWDVMFVAFCQHYAGIPEDVIPQCASLLQLRTELENAHPEYITPGGSEATPGDIVLYTNTAGEETIGIVTEYDGTTLTVVSGAVDGAVAAVTVADADVADTISVLDAYGVYAQTGASDGLEEFSLDADAILARDGAVAYIVWQKSDPIMLAAEDDDTLTAAPATPEYDNDENLKLDELLTKTAISINQNGVWKPLDDHASIKDGTPVRVEIAYTVPAGALPDGKNTATYTLPEGIYPKKDLTGDIIDSNGNTIGTFALTKNSPTVIFTFNNNTSQKFNGTFKFDTTINYAETGGSGQIKLGEKTYTIEPEYSLNTKKEHTLSEDKRKVSYTVIVNAPNGTHDQTVTITDQLAENTANGSYDTSSIKINEQPLSAYPGAEITYNADGRGFEITGLPPLEYNQSYELTYDVTVGDVTGADGSGTIVNTAKGTSGMLQSNEAKDTVTVKESSIAKTGTYDASTHRINWVIKVKNPGGDLAGYTVTDKQVTKLDIVGDVTLESSDGTVVKTIESHEFLTNGYTFPENSTADSYTFTYQTAAPDPVDGTVSATNQATLTKDTLSYTATANVSTGVGDAEIRKVRGTVTPLKDGNQKVTWNVSGNVPAGVTNFKIVDNIRDSYDSYDKLYGIRSELEAAIKSNLLLTMEGGTKLTWKEAEEKGIQITLSFYSNGSAVNSNSDPDGGTPVTDDKTEVHRVRLEFSREDGDKLRILGYSINNIPTVANTANMANNTTRYFVNRAEIYIDDVWQEGWNGRYDYTKIGSITKETSDNSGSGYKQNNSTTYAKDKVIWYSIKLNLGSGDVNKDRTLTVVDKIPDGMKLATDSESLKNYMIAADLDANSGMKYTGSITKLDKNQYGLKPYWTIDTSVPGQLTIQVLPATLNSLIVANKTTDHYVEIRYALQLDDAAWNERTLEEKTYTNTATWGSVSTSSSMTIKRPKKELLEKTGNYDEKTHQANYTLCINPRAENLAPDSDTLELTDTMESEHFGKTGMELMLDSIKVYEYILKDGDWVKGKEIKDSVRVEKVEETASTRKYKFFLPDEKALVLEYSYKMNPGDLANDMPVTNTAELAGKKAVSNPVLVKKDSASATVDNAVLTVAKTDVDTNLAITASSATFEIHHYNKNTKGWELIGTEKTGTNGSFDLTFAQSPAEGSNQLITGDLYRLVEETAPTDYAPDATPHYFIWNKNATDDDKKAAALAAAAGTPVPEGVTIKDISFLGVNGNRATMPIPNKQSSLTLRKIWYSLENDTIEAPVDQIQVQLYRYKDGESKADAQLVGEPVTLTKADDWTAKITSLDDGYHYYVEELGTGSGALIFYEVKYSADNDTGVTGGGTIIITNKQKPSYELPSTGAAGTPPYTAAGALIMGIALMLGYLINKRSHSGGVKIRNNPSTGVDKSDQNI